MFSLICGAAGGGGEAGGNFWTCCRLINQLFLVNSGTNNKIGQKRSLGCFIHISLASFGRNHIFSLSFTQSPHKTVIVQLKIIYFLPTFPSVAAAPSC